MQQDDLIKKWLNDDLSHQELENFKAHEDYNDLIKLDIHLKSFKAPSYNSTNELDTLLNITKTKKPISYQWLKPLLKISAIIIVCFSLYYYTTTLNTTINTLASEKTTIELPDTSVVTLNALSNVTYNTHNWKNSRVINLNGEAFFKVKKGSQFSVNTPHGKVTVLGTQFNVKQRQNYFEVVCFEGSVKVTNNAYSKILEPGDSFVVVNNKLTQQIKETATKPSWLNNISAFKSLPFHYVLKELERQYNVVFDTKNIDTTIIFTGHFPHNNLEQALKSITIPLNLKYHIINNNIVLTSD